VNGPQDKAQSNLPQDQRGTWVQRPAAQDAAGVYPSTSALTAAPVGPSEISARASQLSPQQLEFVQSLVAQGVSGIALNRIIESLPGQDRVAVQAAASCAGRP
jgi:hypothetical protein